jgi:hypothetical protein
MNIEPFNLPDQHMLAASGSSAGLDTRRMSLNFRRG